MTEGQWADFNEERAAILEHDHGLTRRDAEIRAHEQIEMEKGA